MIIGCKDCHCELESGDTAEINSAHWQWNKRKAILPNCPDGSDAVCPRCQEPIQSDVCWCGDDMKKGNHEGHNPTPLGCRCGFSKS